MNQIETAQYVVDTYTEYALKKVLYVEPTKQNLTSKILFENGDHLVVHGLFARHINTAKE